jgi:hypothetical protein
MSGCAGYVWAGSGCLAAAQTVHGHDDHDGGDDEEMDELTTDTRYKQFTTESVFPGLCSPWTHTRHHVKKERRRKVR